MVWSLCFFNVEFFKHVGFFDEKFFLYFEDTDLAIRGKEKGFTTYLYRDLIAFHRLSRSTRKIPKSRRKNVVRSSTMFSVKHFGLLNTFIEIAKEFRKS